MNHQINVAPTNPYLNFSIRMMQILTQSKPAFYNFDHHKQSDYNNNSQNKITNVITPSSK